MAALPVLDRPLVMGILNVTPDSFSDGGQHFAAGDAIEHGLALHAAGADLVDVGGESTRPGALRIAEREELDRVMPVVEALVSAGVPVSIDTMRAGTAAAAVAGGACLVNDVSGGLADPHMHAVIASLDVDYIAMHWRGHSADMDALAEYGDVVADVRHELLERVESARAAGIDDGRIIIDPGLGFAKHTDHNWQLLNGLGELTELGYRVVIGASRKRFLGALLAGGDGQPRPFVERDAASDAVSALAAYAGAWAVRVHDVARSRDSVLVGQAWRRAHG